MLHASTLKKGRYPSFDLVRLLLALEVVVAHTWPSVDPEANWGGFIMAVPAFLAISGFLVLKSYESSGSWPVFAKKRALRILPALIASFVLGFVLFDLSFVKSSFVTWITGGLYTLPGLTNPPLWSLAWEELAYLGLAVLWAIGAYKKPLFIWGLLCAASILSWYVVHIGLAPLYQIISFLPPAFFVGNLAYIHREQIAKLGSVLPWVFFVGVCICGLSMHPILQAIATVWAGMAGFRILPERVPDISYGIYIYHIPVMYFITITCGITNSTEVILLMTFTVIPLSLASWYLIERPALRLKPKAQAGPVSTSQKVCAKPI